MTAFRHGLLSSSLLKFRIPHAQVSQKVAVFAHQLMRHDKGLTLADAMTYAWDEIKKFGHLYRLIKFTKTNGEVAQRVVIAAPATDYIRINGNGRPMKPGQVLFADAARIHCGKSNVAISTYKSLIIEQF